MQEARAGGLRLCPQQETAAAKAVCAFPEPRQLSQGNALHVHRTRPLVQYETVKLQALV